MRDNSIRDAGASGFAEAGASRFRLQGLGRKRTYLSSIPNDRGLNLERCLSYGCHHFRPNTLVRFSVKGLGFKVFD